MIVIVVEKAPPGLRGELTRWLLEPQTGVFVGSVSAIVRDRLWEKCQKGIRKGGALQIWTTNNEQGFALQAIGEFKRDIVNLEGLQLVRIPG
jgi:CRISPR-associated protein Cas2